MKQMRKTLREVTTRRVVGFGDAIADLGTHEMYGYQVPYSKKQVYDVLKAKTKSERLLVRMAERRPDLFGLSYVAPEIKEWYENWKMEMSELEEENEGGKGRHGTSVGAIEKGVAA